MDLELVKTQYFFRNSILQQEQAFECPSASGLFGNGAPLAAFHLQLTLLKARYCVSLFHSYLFSFKSHLIESKYRLRGLPWPLRPFVSVFKINLGKQFSFIYEAYTLYSDKPRLRLDFLAAILPKLITFERTKKISNLRLKTASCNHLYLLDIAIG